MTSHLIICLPRLGYIKSQSAQLPVVMIAQLVEHCTGIAEVIGSNLVQAWICFQVLISQLLKLCVYKCYNVFIRVFSVVTL